MKNKTLIKVFIPQITIFIIFLLLTIGNEILDIPHYLLNDTTTTHSQRYGEMIIEISIFFSVMIFQIFLFMKQYRKIRILEGYIPICANCKNIRSFNNNWEKLESYITKYSLAKFSHSICPDCMKKLYPQFDGEV